MGPMISQEMITARYAVTRGVIEMVLWGAGNG